MNRTIWASDDPVAAIRQLIGGARRGRKPVNTRRDFEIAVHVAELVHDGRTADAAIEIVQQGTGLSVERIKAIWLEHRMDAEIEDVLRRPWLGRGFGNSAEN